MDNLSQYLKRFKKILSHEFLVRKCVIDVVGEKIGVTLKKESVSVNNGVISIKTRSVIKNEIFIHKKELVDQVNKKLGTVVVYDIT